VGGVSELMYIVVCTVNAKWVVVNVGVHTVNYCNLLELTAGTLLVRILCFKLDDKSFSPEIPHLVLDQNEMVRLNSMSNANRFTSFVQDLRVCNGVVTTVGVTFEVARRICSYAVRDAQLLPWCAWPGDINGTAVVHNEAPPLSRIIPQPALVVVDLYMATSNEDSVGSRPESEKEHDSDKRGGSDHHRVVLRPRIILRW
jgi:hypothetical protein